MLTLSQLKTYLRGKPMVTVQEISISLQEDVQLVTMMLQHFINKGQVKICPRKPQCGTQCQKCSFAQTQFYEWCDSPLS